MKSNQYKPRHNYRCMVCGRWIGNTNLGGYMTDKTSKRGSKAYCQRCIDRILTEGAPE